VLNLQEFKILKQFLNCGIFDIVQSKMSNKLYFTVNQIKASKDSPFQLLINDEVFYTFTTSISEEKYVRKYFQLLGGPPIDFQ
jgi:hypothetical protein